MATIIPIETPTLGNRSYLVHDGTDAFVVDPQRDIDRVLALAEQEGVQIRDVFETHLHNDYVTGGLALAELVGATYHVNADDDVSYERHGVRDGDVIAVSDNLCVRVIATPGHTFTHLSYAVESGGEVLGVFTGGSLLFGATGRPDLLGTEHASTLAHHQYNSVQRLASELPDAASVHPTHGFGSFCSASATSGHDASTIAQEKQLNPALTQGEDEWVAMILAGLDAYPAYYAQMTPANSAGPDAPDLSAPEPADKETLARRIADGEWVIDLRTRTAYSSGHVGGSVNIGLDGQFSTYVGWLIPWGAPLTILAETPEEVAEAQRELVRIGVDRLEGAATGSPQEWSDEPLAQQQRATFADLSEVRHHRPVQVLDVRRDGEVAGGMIEGAQHLPLHSLLRRIDEVPDGELWVHCAGGYRASIATSLLARSGRVGTVLIDDNFEENAAAAGLPVSVPSVASAPKDAAGLDVPAAPDVPEVPEVPDTTARPTR